MSAYRDLGTCCTHLHTLLVIAVLNNLFIGHIDARNAFLHVDSDFEYYVEQPEGFVEYIAINQIDA